jgi:hypothetical protein
MDPGLGLRGDAYVRFLRKALCPSEMLEEDGALSGEYFAPKTVTSDGVEWSAESEDKLLNGLEQFGVGKWEEIRMGAGLTYWDEFAIRLKTCLLLGSQDIESYLGRRLSRAEVAAEHAANEAAGRAQGDWYCGVRASREFGWLHGLEEDPAGSRAGSGAAPGR